MLKILKILFIANVFLCYVNGYSQNYPEVILPNSHKSIQSGNDTLWVLKDSQLKKAILAAKKLEICEESNQELDNKISKLLESGIARDSLVQILKTDRDYYMANWKTCSDDIDLLLKKNKRQKFLTRLSFLGIGVAFIGGFLIGN